MGGRRRLVARKAVPVVRLMLARGIFAPIVPEIDAGGVDRLARLAEAEAVDSISPDPIRRLAALLTRVPETAATIAARSEEHKSEIQAIMRISYAVISLKNKTDLSIEKNT